VGALERTNFQLRCLEALIRIDWQVELGGVGLLVGHSLFFRLHVGLGRCRLHGINRLDVALVGWFTLTSWINSMERGVREARNE
jgi:hypothetical protein